MQVLNVIKKFFLRAGLLVFVLLFATGLIITSNQRTNAVNLLTPTDWTHFPGAEATADGIRFKPIGRVITHKDTSTPQLNPPVNVRGSHLKLSGDFQVEIGVSGVENGATVQLYGRVPIIYDEWRQERQSIRVEAASTGLSVRIWDGTSASSVDERIYKIPLKNDIKVLLTHTAGRVTVRLNSKTLGFIPDHGIFGNGTVWFGADASAGTEGWTLTSFKARGIGKGRVELISPPGLSEPHSQPDSLRNRALNHPRQLAIGAAISYHPLFTDTQYRQTAVGQFSMITPENSMKPQSIHPQKNLYIYQEADSLVQTALHNKMSVHGHALVLGKANPSWMQRTPKSERRQVMVDHITNVVSHFRGKVAEWDVVNEPMSDDDVDYANQTLGLRDHIWFEAMGEDYIDAAFRAARAADPNAKLYLNEYGLEKDGKRWDAFVGLVKRLQARGVPIDGVGFESHVYHEPHLINPEVLREHIRILAKLGLVSRVSEIDVLGDDPLVQASQYADILQVCLSEPSCTSFTTWGVTDLYGSTTLSDRYPVVLGDSLLYGADFAPKPAQKALQKTLKQK